MKLKLLAGVAMAAAFAASGASAQEGWYGAVPASRRAHPAGGQRGVEELPSPVGHDDRLVASDLRQRVR